MKWENLFGFFIELNSDQVRFQLTEVEAKNNNDTYNIHFVSEGDCFTTANKLAETKRSQSQALSALQQPHFCHPAKTPREGNRNWGGGEANRIESGNSRPDVRNVIHCISAFPLVSLSLVSLSHLTPVEWISVRSVILCCRHAWTGFSPQGVNPVVSVFSNCISLNDFFQEYMRCKIIPAEGADPRAQWITQTDLLWPKVGKMWQGIYALSLSSKITLGSEVGYFSSSTACVFVFFTQNISESPATEEHFCKQ